MTSRNHLRHGMGTVRPYLYGPASLPEWVIDTFAGEELERVEGERGDHVEIAIGDSVVVIEAGDPPPGATQGSVYIYVPDVDAAYYRALNAGAISIAAPENKSYEERGAGVKDSFGNTWWIATYTGARPPVEHLVGE